MRPPARSTLDARFPAPARRPRGPLRRRVARVVAVAALVTGTVAPATPAAPSTAPARTVLVVALRAPVTPATRDILRRAFEAAATGRAECVVVTMDTPGGLEASMRDVIRAILNGPVPVVVYVSPAGARAASAGALIALAAHVLAMAPGTHIGAAHPVALGAPSPDETMREKITSDAAALARSLADRRGRNVEWAERIVRRSASSTAQEARAAGVVDYVVPTVAALLDSLDGRVLDVAGRPDTLHTRGARVCRIEPTARERLLVRIADPNVAYLLLMAGLFGLLFEFQHPGAVVPGVAGAVALVTAAFGLQMLPVDATGVLLILLALALFVAEVKVASHGVLGAGGAVSLLLGSLMLIDSPLPFLRVSPRVIVPAVIVTGGGFLLLAGLAVRAQRARVRTGRDGLVGARGVARTDVSGVGTVLVRGEYWNARSDTAIEAGRPVEVVAVDGLTLVVRPAPPSAEV